MRFHVIMLLTVAFILPALILSCGEDNEPGKDNNPVLTFVSDEEPGENCPNGGTRVDTGFDANNNGVLDEEEINDTRFVCHGEDGKDGKDGDVGADGKDGKDGTDGLDGTGCTVTDNEDGTYTIVCGEDTTITISDGAKGDQGEKGDQGDPGEKGESCTVVDNENGTYTITCGEVEVIVKDGEKGVTGEKGEDGEKGDPGNDGHNSIIEIETIDPGDEDCPAGGQLVKVGIDADDDGMLGEGEVSVTQKVCHGVEGEKGEDGYNSLIEVTPDTETCPAGGYNIKTGIDTNGNLVLDTDPNEVVSSVFVCNGVDGKSATVSVSEVAPGEEGCVAGGYKIEVGIEGATPETVVVCHGEKGDKGDPGEDGVCAGNNAPVINAIKIDGVEYIGEPVHVVISNTAEIIIEATDPDGGTLNYSIHGGFAEIIDNGGGSFSITPEAAGTVYFSAIVSDGCQLVMKSFALRFGCPIYYMWDGVRCVPVEVGEMVLIPAGSFWMGCNESVDASCDIDEKPYHEVLLPVFEIDKYEVTAAQYQICIYEGFCNNDNMLEVHYQTTADVSTCNIGNTGKHDHPVNCVSWYGAKAYCEWVGKRLPTEAEWEKAARGGCEFYANCQVETFKYPWGNESITCDYAVTNQGGYGCGTDSTMPVGSKPAGVSQYGVYDMTGNIMEWVNDWLQDDYYSISPTFNPPGPLTGEKRVLKGGSWVNSIVHTRSSARTGYAPLIITYPGYGFRCAKAATGAVCTGQTKCYNDTIEMTCPSSPEDFYGQDAQYADKGSCYHRSYTISGTDPEEIVIDNNTGLQWQRTLSGSTYTWQNAVNYCEGLNYGGHSDWRLPTVEELETLIGYGRHNPAIDTTVFPNTPPSWFWSSSSDVLSPSDAWFVYFYNGHVSHHNKTYGDNARCVRGEEYKTESSFTEETKGGKVIVTARETNIQWTKDYGTGLSWQQALSYCENLDYGGYTDWRLPNIEELKTLVNRNIYSPASDFPGGMPGTWFWSSSSGVGSANDAWVLAFDRGGVDGNLKTVNFNVRCVR